MCKAYQFLGRVEKLNYVAPVGPKVIKHARTLALCVKMFFDHCQLVSECGFSCVYI